MTSVWEVIRYGGSKTLRRALRSAGFSREKRQEKNGTDSEKTTAVAKYYGFERRSYIVFLVREGPLGGNGKDIELLRRSPVVFLLRPP